jgi:carboxymethylenebutenolidase
MPVEGTGVQVPGVDGALDGQLWRPATDGSGAAVVVLPEIDGFCEGTVAAARRLAGAGYHALALDLYTPFGGTPRFDGRDALASWLDRLDDRRQMSDLAMALRWLAEVPGVDPDRRGMVGFSVGGRYAMLATTEPHGLRAVAAFYSRPWPGGAIAERALAPGEHTGAFGAPVCAVFGADDEIIPLEMVERFRGLVLAESGSGHEVHVVPGRHFFANESRPRRYVVESAETAWARVLDFLGRHLSSR